MYLILYYLILHYLILSCHIISYLILSYLNIPYLILSSLMLTYLLSNPRMPLTVHFISVNYLFSLLPIIFIQCLINSIITLNLKRYWMLLTKSCHASKLDMISIICIIWLQCICWLSEWANHQSHLSCWSNQYYQWKSPHQLSYIYIL